MELDVLKDRINIVFIEGRLTRAGTPTFIFRLAGRNAIHGQSDRRTWWGPLQPYHLLGFLWFVSTGLLYSLCLLSLSEQQAAEM